MLIGRLLIALINEMRMENNESEWQMFLIQSLEWRHQVGTKGDVWKESIFVLGPRVLIHHLSRKIIKNN